MNKLMTYIRYLLDFIVHGQFRYLYYAMTYLVNGKTPPKDGIMQSGLGKFVVRKGSLDFQFGNYAYEWEVKKFVYKHYHNYNVFLDIGANIGTYSVLLAKKGMRGYAFEPVKSNLKALEKNLELNKLNDNVRIIPIALGKDKGTVNFTFDPVNTGASHLTDDSIDAEVIINPEFEDIEVDTLDNLMESLGIEKSSRILMKIDVEGMEAHVLEGARSFLASYPHILIIMESVHSGKENLQKLLDQIGKFKYLPLDSLNMAAIKTA